MFTQVHCNVSTSLDTPKVMAATIWKDFGAWIKEKRDAAKLSQDGAARRAGIDRQQWYRIENGLSGTRRDTVIRMAQAVSTNVNEALERAGFAGEVTSAKPQTLAELIETLERMGVENIHFADHDKLQDATPEELQEVLDAVKFAIEITISRQRKELLPPSDNYRGQSLR